MYNTYVKFKNMRKLNILYIKYIYEGKYKEFSEMNKWEIQKCISLIF